MTKRFFPVVAAFVTAATFLSVHPATLQAAPVTPLPQEISPRNPDIHYVGRWDMSDADAPKATWTCSTVAIAFKGTGLNAKLKHTEKLPPSYYQVTVDGQPTLVISPTDTDGLFQVASGLPNKEHVVEIIRRNEAAWSAPFVFQGFQLEKDATVLPSPHSDKRILIIGDSISCGYGNEAQMKEGNPLPKENGYLTYGAITARKFGAEIEIVAWSGRKLYPNNTMVELYDRTLAQDASSKTDLKAWVPDVVLIDLGTNDYNNSKVPPDEIGWINAYKSFIATIRQTAPNAYVFVASGPMGTPAMWDQRAKKVVAELNDAGDKSVSYLPFASQDVNRDGIGGHWHPNLITHKKMAERFSAEIERVTGWKSVAATH